MEVIALENLTKRYGRRLGVEGMDLRLEAGEVCGFLGPNGVGKSTAIRLLLGFLRPSAGCARILGRDAWRDGRRAREDVGYLPGDLRLYPWLTARRALRLVGRIRRRDVLRPGLELLEDLGLEPDLRVSAMSRGMRQKLGLTLALAPRPRLLVLDEPTTSLDPVVQEKLRVRLLEVAAEGRTVFFSSHTLGEVERLCRRVVILRAGRVVEDRPLAELQARAPREVVIRWREAGAPPGAGVPPGLELLERGASLWRGLLTGPVAELLGWLPREAIADLTIGRPDMETLFQRYYRS
jgi:ABC-2 type transport system ATP-binding protein